MNLLLNYPRSKVVRDSNADFRIHSDSDPDVCRIASNVVDSSFITLSVGVSHFAECRESRQVIV